MKIEITKKQTRRGGQTAAHQTIVTLYRHTYTRKDQPGRVLEQISPNRTAPTARGWFTTLSTEVLGAYILPDALKLETTAAGWLKIGPAGPWRIRGGAVADINSDASGAIRITCAVKKVTYILTSA